MLVYELRLGPGALVYLSRGMSGPLSGPDMADGHGGPQNSLLPTTTTLFDYCHKIAMLLATAVPSELLVLMLEELSYQDLISCTKVCAQWHVVPPKQI